MESEHRPEADSRPQFIPEDSWRPRVPEGAVVRTRLLERLDHGFALPVTLISAPAGFGKSVLASQWLETSPRPSLWLSMSRSDGPLAGLVAHLTAGLQGVFEGAFTETSRLLDAPTPAPAKVLEERFARELDALPERTIVVLDDYQAIALDEANDLASDLLAHPSERLHLVILARADPPIGLSSARTHHRLNEIRAADLRFSGEEIAAVMGNELGEPVSIETVSTVEKATEGWPAGVRLSIEASRRHGARGQPVTGASLLDTSYARDFLTAEVLAAQPPAVRRHLLASSVPERFCASLCDALLSDDDEEGAEELTGTEFLAWLERAALFVTPLDHHERWFRYHRLFREMLQRELARVASPERLAELHRRARCWFASEGQTEAAFNHALKVGDAEAAARLAARRGRELLETERFAPLLRWLGEIPRDLADSAPELLVIEAWAASEGQSQFQRMADLLDRAQALLEQRASEPSAWLVGSLEALRAEADYLAGDGARALRGARRSLGLLPTTDTRCLAFAKVVEVLALQMEGRIAEAVVAAQSAMRDAQFRSTSFPPWAWALSYVWWLEADMDRLFQRGADLERLGRIDDLPDTIANGRYFMGVAEYARNEIDAASEHLDAVVERRYLSQPLTYMHGGIGLALCHLARGRSEEAENLAASLAQFAIEMNSPYLQRTADAFLAELLLRQGRRGAPKRWLDIEASTDAAELDEPSIAAHGWMLYSAGTTQVKALMGSDSAEAQRRADSVLSRALGFAERTHHRPLLIQLLGLRAQLDAARGDDAASLGSLRRAVSLSQPGRAVRLLADLGPDLVGLLNRLDVDGEELTHVGLVLGAIEGQGDDGATGSSRRRVAAPTDLPGVDPLSSRELDVIELLARRLTNKEIAQELLISPETVKKHSIRLYRKLGVADRRRAVDKARALGYLDGD